MKKLPQSPTVAFGDKVRAIKAKKNLMLFNVGESNKPTHQNIIIKADEALKKGHTKYSDSQGLGILRDALNSKLTSFNKFNKVSENNILITHGAIHALNVALSSILSYEDECIVIEPMWKTYSSIIISRGAIPVVIQDEDWKGDSIDIELIKSSLTKRTKALIINSPNNPSGKVYSKDFLSKLLQLAHERNFFIVSDEVYERFTYNKNHFSIGSLEKKPARVISVFSFSKSYSMTGWRIGYLVINNELFSQALAFSQISITNIAPFTQKAALTALTDNEVEKDVASFVAEMSKRFSIFSDYLEKNNLLHYFLVPSAGFYSLMDISKFGSSIDISNHFLEEFNIAFTPGIAFGDSMDGFLRISLATNNEEKILDALENVNMFLNSNT